MFYYQPDSEIGTERLLLVQLMPVEHSADHRHIHATIVRRSQKTHTDPDTGRTIYGDDTDTGYRHASWMSAKPGALFIEDFQLTSQMTAREYNGAKGERKLYAVERKFKPYSVDSRLCHLMLKTFTKIDREWSKLDEALGYLRDDNFAANAQRLMAILGIKKFVVYREGRTGDLTRAENFLENKPLDMAYYVEKMMDSVYGAKE